MKDWKKQTVQDLKRYRLLRASLETLPRRVELLRDAARENPRVSRDVDALSRSMELAQQQCDAIDCGMACLTDEEQWVLQRFLLTVNLAAPTCSAKSWGANRRRFTVCAKGHCRK